MSWPKEKSVMVGAHSVATVSNKTIRADHSVIIETTATIENVIYTENWTLPRNPQYSAIQAQTDFDAHILKVATEAAGRLVAHQITEILQ